MEIFEERLENGEVVFIAEWKMVQPPSEVSTVQKPDRPLGRTSHTCTVYKNRFLIVIGGEAESNSSDDLTRL